MSTEPNPAPLSTEPNQDPLARVRQLEREVDELRDRYERTEGMLNGLLQRGLKDMLVKHGAQEFADGNLRLDSSGVQIQTNDSVNDVPALRWFRSFVNPPSDPSAVSTPQNSLSGSARADGSDIYTKFIMRSRSGTAPYAEATTEAQTVAGSQTSTSYLSAVAASNAVSLSASASSANRKIQMLDLNATSVAVALEFYEGTVPPNLLDGMMWMLAAPAVFQARAGGVTETFAFESDVVLLTNANWTDLTDGGATVLHTHAASGGTDPHPFLLMGA